jgi:hypothetical protein
MPQHNQRLRRWRRCGAVVATVAAMTAAILSGALALAPRSQASSVLVVPIDFSRFTAGAPADTASVRVRTVLLNAARYATGTWWTARGYAAQAGTYLSLGGNGEGSIRPPASEAYALAIALQTGALTGPAAAPARATADKLVRSVAKANIANTAAGWGDSCASACTHSAAAQSSLWAAYAGIAGWLLWGDLSSQDQQYVRKMVSREADKLIGDQVPYYKRPDGTVAFSGDTKAEENAWNGYLLGTAVAMMPNHPDVAAWRHKAAEYELSAFSTPADESSPAVYAGRPLSQWLNGSNINPDGTLINHGFTHPDYMTTVSLNYGTVLSDALAGVAAPSSATLNSALVYHALTDVSFAAPPFNAPGGTIYRPGSQAIYYPQTNNSGTERRMHFGLIDTEASLFGFDRTSTHDGAYWDSFHTQRVLDDQNRFTDGRTYSPPPAGSCATAEDTYCGREEWVAQFAAEAYLARWLTHQRPITFANPAVSVVVDNRDRGARVVSGTAWTQSSPATELGPDCKYHAAGTGRDVFSFQAKLGATGSYRVYGWWNAFSNHATNAPFHVTSAAGTSVVRMNQRTAGGGWVLIGTFTFNAGQVARVDLSDDANGFVVADAVMFQKS